MSTNTLFAAAAAAALLFAPPALAQGTGVMVDGADEETTGIGDVEPAERDDPDEDRGAHGEPARDPERADEGPEFGRDHERAQLEANEERDAVQLGHDTDTDPEGGIDGPGAGAGPRF